MLLVALLLSAAPVDPDQTLIGASFEAFARAGEARCPARHLRTISPADLDWEQDVFEERLSASARARLSAARKHDRTCANPDGGLSCPDEQRLDAMARTHLINAFAASACSHLPPG